LAGCCLMYTRIDPDEHEYEAIRDASGVVVGYKQRKRTPEEYRAARRKRLTAYACRLSEALEKINRELATLGAHDG
jgi:hypothetical protein